MTPQEVVGKINGNQIVVVRGPNGILLLRLVDGEYRLEFELQPNSSARQVAYLGAQHILAVLEDGVILIMKEA
ncbi:MAG: hypothetical protein V3S83_12340 [Gemmatimonadota bacterium]